MFCISMYSEGINTNYTCTIRPIIIGLKVDESFYHSYINRISVSFVFRLSSDVNNESASLVYRDCTWKYKTYRDPVFITRIKNNLFQDLYLVLQCRCSLVLKPSLYLEIIILQKSCII